MMDNNEAIDVLSKMREREMMAVIPGSALKPGECIDAIEMAVRALRVKSEAEEYRTRKRPLNIYMRQFEEGECPVCGRPVTEPDNFCHCCGQALDWEASNEE